MDKSLFGESDDAMQIQKATRADRLIKEAFQRIRRNREQLGEAVDSPKHVEALLLNYHYAPDPRHANMQEGDMWYAHDDGHSVFVYPDPTYGVGWHHYAVNASRAVAGKKPYDMRKGTGAAGLNSVMEILHQKGQ
jgi:hypothetical protein